MFYAYDIRWFLGIGSAITIFTLSWFRGLHTTNILRRYISYIIRSFSHNIISWCIDHTRRKKKLARKQSTITPDDSGHSDSSDGSGGSDGSGDSGHGDGSGHGGGSGSLKKPDPLSANKTLATTEHSDKHENIDSSEPKIQELVILRNQNETTAITHKNYSTAQLSDYVQLFSGIDDIFAVAHIMLTSHIDHSDRFSYAKHYRKDADASPHQNIPLDIITSYLNRYGIVCEKIRVTSWDNIYDQRKTFISLTFSARKNIQALSIRSAEIPLAQTAEATTRRLAYHLREIGWQVSEIPLNQLPNILPERYHEHWSLIESDTVLYSTYRISVNGSLDKTLQQLWSYPAASRWTVLECFYNNNEISIALYCTFVTVKKKTPVNSSQVINSLLKIIPHFRRWNLYVPRLPFLTLERGMQVPFIQKMAPTSTANISPHNTLVDKEMLDNLHWSASSYPTHSITQQEISQKIQLLAKKPQTTKAH